MTTAQVGDVIIIWLLTTTAVNNRIQNGTNKCHNRLLCNYYPGPETLCHQSGSCCSQNSQNKVNLRGHWASWKDFRTTWLQPVFSAQPALTVITEWVCECVCARACLYSKCVESGAGSPDKAWGEAPWREVWVEGRATAETTFQIKATSLWGVQVSTQLYFHTKKLKMQMHSSHSNYMHFFIPHFKVDRLHEERCFKYF